MSYQKKPHVFFSLLVVLIFFLQAFLWSVASYAEDIISNRMGIIRITQPDGTVLVVGRDEPLAPIASGSTVELLDGSMVVAPTEGFIQIVAGDSVAMVRQGERLRVSVEAKIRMVDFSVDSGEVSIITGNTTTTARAGQEVQIGLDKFTGMVRVRSISGDINTNTAGVRALVLHGGLAQIRVDAQTRLVRIDSTEGMVEVISPEGERLILARGESKDVQGSIAGEVLTFPSEEVEIARIIPTEEPTEPEVPEASPYRP